MSPMNKKARVLLCLVSLLFFLLRSCVGSEDLYKKFKLPFLWPVS